MKLLPLYRVHKENHNSQYFYNRKLAEEFAREHNAEWDIVYTRNRITALEKINQNGEW